MFFGKVFAESLIYSLIGIIALVSALFVAMPVHEFAHAVAAKHEGDYTAVAHRRCTLAFHSHFDWRGFLFLLLFSFGWAKPVPVDERNFKRGRKSKFLVSIAGILANLILGTLFLFIFLLILKIAPEFYTDTTYGYLVYQFLNISVSLNFMLVIFNLLPLYPLDGHKILESFVKYDNKFLAVTKEYSLLIYILLAVTGLYSIYYTYTAGYLVEGLTRVFAWILRLWRWKI